MGLSEEEQGTDSSFKVKDLVDSLQRESGGDKRRETISQYGLHLKYPVCLDCFDKIIIRQVEVYEKLMTANAELTHSMALNKAIAGKNDFAEEDVDKLEADLTRLEAEEAKLDAELAALDA